MTTLAELLVKVDVDLDESGISVAVEKIDRHVTRMADSAEDGAERMERSADKAERSMSSIEPDGSLGGRLRSMFTDAGDDAESGADNLVKRVGGRLLSGLRNAIAVGGKPVAITAATAFTAPFLEAVVSGLISGAGKIAHGLGAAMALAPAAIAGVVLSVGTLKLALSGVGDALSAGLSGDLDAFEESLEGLSPSARTFAREIVGLKGGFDDLKGAVQESFFERITGQVRPLAETYLPMLRTTMSHVATSFGGAVAQTAGWLRMPGVAQAVGGAMGNLQTAIRNVVMAATGLLPAFLPLLTVGSSFLPGLTGGLGGATSAFRDFMQEAERTGKLREFIQGGIDDIKSLIETGGKVVGIFVDIGQIVGLVFDAAGLKSGGFIDTIGRGVATFEELLRSAQGGTVLAQVFGVVGAVLDNVMGTLSRVGGMLGRVFGPHMPVILDFVEAFFRLKAAVLDTGLDALEPVLVGIGAVLGTVVLPALTSLATWLAANQPVLQGIGIAIMTLLIPAFVAWAISAGAAAIATLAAVWPILLIGAAIAALAALFIIHWETIKRAVAAAFNWIKTNWPLVLAILTGPIGIAVLLIVNHWDKIKGAAMAVYNWLRSNWPLVLAILTGPIGLAVLAISRNWQSIMDGGRRVIDWFRQLPGRITGAIGNVGRLLVSAGRAIIDGLLEGIRDAMGPVEDFVGGIADTISSIKGPLPYDKILLIPQGEAIMGGLLKGIMAGALDVYHEVGTIGPEIADTVATPRVPATAAVGGGGAPVIVNVQGSVLSERDLLDKIREFIGRGDLPPPGGMS